MSQKGKKTLNLLLEVYENNTLEKINNFDKGIIGIEVETKRLIYSVRKCIKILKKRIPEEDVVDYFYSEIYSESKCFGKVIFCEDYLIKK